MPVRFTTRINRRYTTGCVSVKLTGPANDVTLKLNKLVVVTDVNEIGPSRTILLLATAPQLYVRFRQFTQPKGHIRERAFELLHLLPGVLQLHLMTRRDLPGHHELLLIEPLLGFQFRFRHVDTPANALQSV